MHFGTGEGEVWIGLAEVCQRPGTGVLMDRNLAFVNALVPARDAAEFTRKLTQALDDLGFDLEAVEDVEPLSERIRTNVVDPGLLQLAEDAARTGAPRLGRFHTWIGN